MPHGDGRRNRRRTLGRVSGHSDEQGRIEIRGFGSFAPRYRQGGMRRNPRSGEKVYAPARWVVIFRAGKDLREAIDARTERKA